MSDHGSGPRASADPVLDITDLYAFPSPERPGNLVLAMNVFPFAMPTELFSDSVDYRFRVRPVQVGSSGERPSFAVGASEGVVSLTFDTPRSGAGGKAFVQDGVCTLGSGETIALRVGDEQGSERGGTRVFAGCRLDSFFIDQGISGGIRISRRLPIEVPGRNSLDGQNVLTIVVEGSVSDLFGIDDGPLFAVVAETTTRGSPRIRLERLGRPEIKNFIMLDKTADAVNHDLEIRDLYDAEDVFKLMPDYVGAYRARLNANLAFYDGLDGKVDWPLDARGNHPLMELLLADFLVVDLSKPFDDASYFEIERALLRGSAYATCGGRWLNDDIVDKLLTLLVDDGNGPGVTDGVDQATVPAARTFPYARPANPSPPGPPSVALPPSEAAA
jgi:hypothetical protein